MKFFTGMDFTSWQNFQNFWKKLDSSNCLKMDFWESVYYTSITGFSSKQRHCPFNIYWAACKKGQNPEQSVYLWWLVFVESLHVHTSTVNMFSSFHAFVSYWGWSHFPQALKPLSELFRNSLSRANNTPMQHDIMYFVYTYFVEKLF